MSIIQKLENSYVAILRVVVIVVASLLLVSAAVFGVMSLKAMLQGSPDEMQVTPVDPKDVLAQVAPGEKRGESSTAEEPAASEDSKKNPYQADYDKIYTIVSGFIHTTSKNAIKFEKHELFPVLDQFMAKYEADEVKAEYIKGLVAAFQASLGDKRIITRIEKPLAAKVRPVAAPAPKPAVMPEPVAVEFDADGNAIEPQAPQPAPAPEPEPVVEELPYKESPLVVVNEVVTAYNKMFDAKVAEASMQQEKAAMGQQEAKANASTRMMLAAGLFAAFLLVIFLTIAIRIERNLRDIAIRT